MLKYFRNRPTIRELNCLKELSNSRGSDDDNHHRKNESETLNSFIAKILKGLSDFSKKKRERDGDWLRTGTHMGGMVEEAGRSMDERDWQAGVC